jgi:hypothetical protein
MTLPPVWQAPRPCRRFFLGLMTNEGEWSSWKGAQADEAGAVRGGLTPRASARRAMGMSCLRRSINSSGMRGDGCGLLCRATPRTPVDSRVRQRFREGVRLGMTTIEQYYKNCKTVREQLARIEQHIKGHSIYTAFDFGKVQSMLAEYETWAQANTGVIDAALKTANS